MRAASAIGFLLLLVASNASAFNHRYVSTGKVIGARFYSSSKSGRSVSMLLDNAIIDTVMSSSSSLLTSEEPIASSGSIGYSNLSLYFTLALYVFTLPGLYSLVTRSVKTTMTERIYEIPGPANPTAKPLRQTAGEVMAYFKANNYQVETADDVIIFKGILAQSKSQAAFLTFCTFMGLGSLALVLSILVPDVGSKVWNLVVRSFIH